MIGHAIRQVRREKDLRLEDVAEACGVTAATISRYERGTRSPSGEMLLKIASALGVTVEELSEAPIASVKAATNANPTGYVTSKAELRAWHECVMAAGIDDPRLLLLFLVLEHYIDRELWVISSTLPELAAQAALPIDLVEDLWPEILASAFVERVGTGEWMLRLFVPADDDQPG